MSPLGCGQARMYAVADPLDPLSLEHVVRCGTRGQLSIRVVLQRVHHGRQHSCEGGAMRAHESIEAVALGEHDADAPDDVRRRLGEQHEVAMAGENASVTAASTDATSSGSGT